MEKNISQKMGSDINVGDVLAGIYAGPVKAVRPYQGPLAKVIFPFGAKIVTYLNGGEREEIIDNSDTYQVLAN